MLVIDCLFLILLVLVQLPKKDAGAGMAFGGGTADALFGAGSGNLLTKITGWTAGILLGLCLLLGFLQGYANKDTSGSEFTRMVESQPQRTATAPLAPKPAASTPAAAAPAANSLVPATLSAATNAPVAVPASTNTAK